MVWAATPSLLLERECLRELSTLRLCAVRRSSSRAAESTECFHTTLEKHPLSTSGTNAGAVAPAGIAAVDSEL